MMKLVVLSALVAVALGDVSHLLLRGKPHHQPLRPIPVAPVPKYSSPSGPVIAILRQSSDISPDGGYQWAYETENGIAAQEQASVRLLGPEQAEKSAQGSFQWTSPEGVPVAISYVADENGYQPTGDALPTPPPVPVAIARALEWIAAHPEPASPVLNRRF